MFLKRLMILTTLCVSCIIAHPLTQNIESSNLEEHLGQPITAVIRTSENNEKSRALETEEYTLPLIKKSVPFSENIPLVRKVRHLGFGGGFGGFGGGVVLGGVSAAPIYTSVPIVSTITTVPVVSSVSTIQTLPSYGYGNYGGYGGGNYGGYGGGGYGYNYKSFGFGGGFLG